MDTVQFSSWKRGVFRHGKEIKGLCGGVHRYAAQASPQIDAARAEKNRFRTETNYGSLIMMSILEAFTAADRDGKNPGGRVLTTNIWFYEQVIDFPGGKTVS